MDRERDGSSSSPGFWARTHPQTETTRERPERVPRRLAYIAMADVVELQGRGMDRRPVAPIG